MYATFEDAWADVENEVDTSYAEAYEATDEHAAAQQHQARFQDELKSSLKSHYMAHIDLKETMSKVDDTREVLDIACRGLEGASKRTI